MNKNFVKWYSEFATLHRRRGGILNTLFKIYIIFCHWLSKIYKKERQVRFCACSLKNLKCAVMSLIMLWYILSKSKLYKGNCKTSFKKRYSNHKKSFNIPFYKHDTKLSTEYWTLRMKQLNPQIPCKIKGIYKSYNPTSNRCKLCFTEKLEILEDPDKNLLNRRSEIISQCHHKKK